MTRIGGVATGTLVAVLLTAGGANAQRGESPPQGQPQVRVTGDAPHDQAPGVTMSKPTISAKGAQTIIDAITAYAVKERQGVSIAVVDEGGNLVAFKRLDGATLGTIQAATTKAVSALRLQAPTSNFGQLAQQNVGLAMGFLSAGFTILGGGQPIRANGEVVGAVAVSGGVGGQDDALVTIGLDAFKP